MTLYVSERLGDEKNGNIDIKDENSTLTILHSIIFRYFNDIYIKNYIRRNYNFLTASDKEIVLYKIKSSINKNNLLIKLKNIEFPENYIDVEGVINFRLKEFKENIDISIDEEVEDLINKKEYESFLKLLRFFLNIQTPQFKKLHIVCCKENFYKFYDENFKEVKKGLVESSGNFFGEELTNDDILVSFILSTAPEKIVIHNLNNLCNSELLKTLKVLYEENLSFCIGCEIDNS